MPIPVFAMLVFAICTWAGAGVVEAVMTDFATEVGISTWSFIAVPGLFAMLFAFFFYRHAETRIIGIEQSMSRALAVAVATWLAIALMVSALWCPGYRALTCAADIVLVTGVIGGGPLLLASIMAGLIVGLVLRRRVSWLAYKAAVAP
jgi:hypothetical protein